MTQRFLAAFLAAALAAIAPGALGHGEAKNTGKAAQAASAEEKSFGREGDPKKASRTVEVDMNDQMRFHPAELTVKQGETIRFRVRNSGKVMHEMVLGAMADLKAHAEMMRKHPGMEHEEPYIAHVAPGRTGTMVWQFTKAGEFHFGCLVPGHLEAGMLGRIKVVPASSAASGESAPPLAEGEVRKVDRDAQKITVRHGPLPHLDMPMAMTMVYRVKDPAMLDRVKAGDKVRFQAEKIGGAFTLTEIEAVR